MYRNLFVLYACAEYMLRAAAIHDTQILSGVSVNQNYIGALANLDAAGDLSLIHI